MLLLGYTLSGQGGLSTNTKNERGRQLRYSKLVRSDQPSCGNLAGRWPLLFSRCCWRLEWAVPAQPPAPCWGRFSAARDKTAGRLAATGIRWNDGPSRVPLTLGPFLLTRGPRGRHEEPRTNIIGPQWSWNDDAWVLGMFVSGEHRSPRGRRCCC
jgi:hypothetical protein